ncbi:hypothetical protein V7S43_002252 [Phytophthora oleae]|uniref:Uncharacterized protein n=1 Tax=Phytophthora oleae TaxID=2107226 RepID=A0ABD3G4M5_9STRA
MEFWPDPAKHLDTLHPHDRKKILNQLKILYQGRTEQSIYHMKAWKLLAHYSKWRHVFRPLILRQQAGKTTVPRKARNETVNYEEKKAATTTSISHERPVSASSTERVTGAKRRQEGEDHVSYPEYMGVKVKGDVAVVAPIIRLDQTKQPLGKKKARNATQTLEWIRTIESKGYSASPTRNVPAVTPQKLEKTQLLNVKSSQNSDGDATERVSGVHLALAWANISCSCVDMSPRLEESHDWFWFLVSSIYFDLADCRSDIEQILRKVWCKMRAQIATFHSLYEKELTRTSTTSRADRESMVSRALEGYWTRNGHWFRHRAAWEVLECHKD